MFYYTYKTTNLKNGKYYYGRHSAKRLRNLYLGSGTIFKRALKKYGSFYFVKEILEVYFTPNEAISAEARLITRDVVNDPKCYNIALGGLGTSGVSTPHTEEWNKNSSIAAFKRWKSAVWTEEMIAEYSVRTTAMFANATEEQKREWVKDRKNTLAVFSVDGTKKFIAMEDFDSYIKRGYVPSKLAVQKVDDKANGVVRGPISLEIKKENMSIASRKRWDKAKNSIVIRTPEGKRKFIQREDLEIYLATGHIYIKAPRKKQIKIKVPRTTKRTRTPITEHVKMLIGDANRKCWVLRYNDTEIIVPDLKKFCLQKSLPYKKILKRRPHNGCQILREHHVSS
jgi:hypothetical protein